MADYIDYYSVLGVPKGSGEAEIKSAYHKLAMKYHPDRNQGNKASEAKFKEANEAYEVLSDPEKRRLYDQHGKDWQNSQQPRSSHGGYQGRGQGGFQYQSSGGRGDDFSQFGDFSDFFQSMFGGAGGEYDQMSGGGPGRSQLDMEAELQLSIEDLFRGGTKQLAFSFRNGRKTETRDIKVKLPEKITDGSTIRLRGQGKSAGGRSGDLYLRVRLMPDPRFEIKGSDLEAKVPVMPWDAALGAVVSVQAPDGPVTIKLPPGSAAGRQLRLPGRGLPTANGRGNLYVVIEITLPAKLSAKQLELFRKMKEVS